MTIGEKLEEARKRKGVSIREAAEATKIRGDFLLSLESNSVDIPLPEIYVRGFLKNYARFLRLDADRIITDYDATRLGQSAMQPDEPRMHEGTSPSGRESLGRMDLAPRQEPARPAEPSEPAHEPTEPTEPAPARESARATLPEVEGDDFHARGPTIRERFQDSELRTLYLKLALLGLGAIILVVLIALLVNLMRSGDAEPTHVASEAVPAEAVTEASPPVAETEEIRLIARDSVTVIVDQVRDNTRLFSGTLDAGESHTFERAGPVTIRFTDGDALVVEIDGQRFRMGSSGVGYTRLD